MLDIHFAVVLKISCNWKLKVIHRSMSNADLNLYLANKLDRLQRKLLLANGNYYQYNR